MSDNNQLLDKFRTSFTKTENGLDRIIEELKRVNQVTPPAEIQWGITISGPTTELNNNGPTTFTYSANNTRVNEMIKVTYIQRASLSDPITTANSRTVNKELVRGTATDSFRDFLPPASNRILTIQVRKTTSDKIIAEKTFMYKQVKPIYRFETSHVSPVARDVSALEFTATVTNIQGYDGHVTVLYQTETGPAQTFRATITNSVARIRVSGIQNFNEHIYVQLVEDREYTQKLLTERTLGEIFLYKSPLPVLDVVEVRKGVIEIRAHIPNNKLSLLGSGKEYHLIAGSKLDSRSHLGTFIKHSFTFTADRPSTGFVVYSIADSTATQNVITGYVFDELPVRAQPNTNAITAPTTDALAKSLVTKSYTDTFIRSNDGFGGFGIRLVGKNVLETLGTNELEAYINPAQLVKFRELMGSTQLRVVTWKDVNGVAVPNEDEMLARGVNSGYKFVNINDMGTGKFEVDKRYYPTLDTEDLYFSIYDPRRYGFVSLMHKFEKVNRILTVKEQLGITGLSIPDGTSITTGIDFRIPINLNPVSATEQMTWQWSTDANSVRKTPHDTVVYNRGVERVGNAHIVFTNTPLGNDATKVNIHFRTKDGRDIETFQLPISRPVVTPSTIELLGLSINTHIEGSTPHHSVAFGYEGSLVDKNTVTITRTLGQQVTSTHSGSGLFEMGTYEPDYSMYTADLETVNNRSFNFSLDSFHVNIPGKVSMVYNPSEYQTRDDIQVTIERCPIGYIIKADKQVNTKIWITMGSVSEYASYIYIRNGVGFMGLRFGNSIISHDRIEPLDFTMHFSSTRRLAGSRFGDLVKKTPPRPDVGTMTPTLP